MSEADRELRDYQIEGIERLRSSLRSGHRRPVLQSATGSGKTRLAGEIFRLAREKQNRVVFVVPRIDLVDQTLESFRQDGIDDPIGVIQADHIETDWSRPIQIASIQTIQRRGHPEAKLVIVDECHMSFEATNKWLHAPNWQKIPFIGLSATPWTKGLGKHWDDLIVVATTKDLIERGYLCDFRVFAPSHPDLTGVKVRMGDYAEGELSKAMDKPKLVADVVETWCLRGENRPTLAFAVDRAHAKSLQRRFEECGIACGYQDAFTKMDERQEIRRKFRAGVYKVVTSVGTLTTGVDWDVRCIILARPTKSEILYVQMVGRGLRTAEGKQDCLILDHSDTTLRLGFVTDIHHDQLNDGTERKSEPSKAPLPKECPKCAYLMPPRTMTCPNCGHVKQIPLGLMHEKGELVELSREGKKAAARKAGVIRIRGRELPLEMFYQELLGFASIKGYAPGWAAHKYKAAVGEWPSRLFSKEPVPPSYEIHNYSRSMARSYAKKHAADD